jgi:hypothetical protein
MMTYCHVMWHDDRGSCWTSPNFQTGFGCCSAASGFATTSQPKLPNCQQTAREYLNFMLSNSSKALERDRVADNWWLQVWLSVGKMLDSAEYATWCSFLASDERTWLTPGKILGGLGEGIWWNLHTSDHSDLRSLNWVWVKTLYPCSSHQNSW